MSHSTVSRTSNQRCSCNPDPFDCEEPATTRAFSRRGLIVRTFGALVVLSLLTASAIQAESRRPAKRRTSANPRAVADKVVKSNAEWKRLLTREQYHILREAGTEQAFANRYHDHKEEGVYACVACDNRVFASSAKFESGTGWPSFFEPNDSAAVRETRERTWLFGSRIEVACSRCEGHLGHVFDDGPKPTGLRYCLNSAALTFHPENPTGIAELTQRTK